MRVCVCACVRACVRVCVAFCIKSSMRDVVWHMCASLSVRVIVHTTMLVGSCPSSVMIVTAVCVFSMT